MKYLVLTDNHNEKVRINFDLVREYHRESDSRLTTVIIVTPFTSNQVYVQETPEDIDWMLSKEGNVVSIGVIAKPSTPGGGGGSGATAENHENLTDTLDEIDKVSARNYEETSNPLHF